MMPITWKLEPAHILELLLESAPVGITVLTTDLKYVVVSRTVAEEFVQLPEKEILGRYCYDVIGTYRWEGRVECLGFQNRLQQPNYLLEPKNSCRISAASFSPTPEVTPILWFSAGSAVRSITVPVAPLLGSRAPKARRSMRARTSAPAHMGQGSRVT